MTETAVPRPRQATLSGWLVVTGSLFLILLAFQRMSTLGSIDFQESTSKMLADPPASGLGLSVDDVQAILRVLCFVTAGCAAATAILGWHAMRRSVSARLALSIVTPVLLVAGFVVASFPAMLVGVGVVMLWLQPTRDWFLGRAARPVVAEAPPAQHPSAPAPPYPVTPPSSASRAPAPGPLLAAPHLPVHLRAPEPARRPRAVLLACVVTWVTCAVVGVLSLLSVLVVLVAPGDLLDQVRPQLDDAGLTDHQFVVTTVVTGSLLALWTAVAAGLAVAAMLHRPWGAWGLLASASVAGLLCLVSAVATLEAVVPLAACGFVVAQLLRPESRAWFAARPGPRVPRS